jgi:putative membrane protein
MMTAQALTVMLADPAGWGWWGGGAAAHGWGGWFWIFPLAWLAFWAILIGLVAWYLIAGRRRSSLDEARRILAERYARGELSPDEYRERLGQLR